MSCIAHKDAAFPQEYYKDTLSRTTLCDYLTRQFEKQINAYTFRAKGSGKSGLISVSHCGQEVLARTACEISENGTTPDFLSASLQTAAPSMPLSWKKSSLNFFRSVSARHSLSSQNARDLKSFRNLPGTRIYPSGTEKERALLHLWQTAPFFPGKAAFPPVP